MTVTSEMRLLLLEANTSLLTWHGCPVNAKPSTDSTTASLPLLQETASTIPSPFVLHSLSSWPSLDPPVSLSTHIYFHHLTLSTTKLTYQMHSTEETQEFTNDAYGKCLSGMLLTSVLHSVGFGLTNNGLNFTDYPVIGYHNRLQASGTCLDNPNDGLTTACPWDSRIKGEFFHQTTFSINLSVVKDFIHDVQSLVALDPKSLCVLKTSTTAS
ncbi:unnamed protein product [Linum trigynum]|uniref:Uncharacterized protein n=1 Tax=Linum trigynum TaxID=586398 RepID=A0AAV2DN55_9ROSI